MAEAAAVAATVQAARLGKVALVFQGKGTLAGPGRLSVSHTLQAAAAELRA
jgi:sorbitol-specific phosphotransferase system component IIA